MTDLRDAVESIKEHHAGKITLRTSTVQKAKPIVIVDSGNSGRAIPEILAGAAGTRSMGQNDLCKCGAFA